MPMPLSGHLITGPILLQMDDLLLDDLQINSIAERQVLLAESRRLCLHELELVDRALEYKQKLEEIPKSKRDGNTIKDIKGISSHPDQLEKAFVENDMSTYRTTDENVKRNPAAACLGKADEVATRATLMVTILSQENSSLREQLQKSSKKDLCINKLQKEISQLKSENYHLRSKAHALEMENKNVLDELREISEKYEKIRNCKDIIDKLKQENIFLQDKFQAFKCKTIERELMRSFCHGIKNDNSCSLQNSHVEDCHSDCKQEENDLHLINKVYTANKRCAELEDTIRRLYAELLLTEHGKKYLESPNACIDKAEEEQAPSEPEWPSLIGRLPTKDAILEKSDEQGLGIVNRLTTQGLPTDSDEDIWRIQSINSNSSLKGFGGSDDLVFHKWNV
ncbi:uncharacterized protein LOC116292510 isoform X2 [Actinia tenebrosa]|uniref:Uncharacterized protein LOC116292510 isoform X2 n=1 Tax=Actinia tenebrosa TaxID=6105 RepID=A0A6P8HSU6_ACTTE|nr:uncharacterized protein LOC116292510 isoform X2 [Actinia tenebrosa]